MANQEHLDILKQGMEFWNDWRERNRRVRVNLRGADLRGMDLARADFGASFEPDLDEEGWRKAREVGMINAALRPVPVDLASVLS